MFMCHFFEYVIESEIQHELNRLTPSPLKKTFVLLDYPNVIVFHEFPSLDESQKTKINNLI